MKIIIGIIYVFINILFFALFKSSKRADIYMDKLKKNNKKV